MKQSSAFHHFDEEIEEKYLSKKDFEANQKQQVRLLKVCASIVGIMATGIIGTIGFVIAYPEKIAAMLVLFARK